MIKKNEEFKIETTLMRTKLENIDSINEKFIEKYEAAKKAYLANIEGVHMSAVMNFFSLALAQINKQIAEMNYSNADTLYRIAKGRYQLGTIAEDELLQMQLSWLNAETARKQADMNLREAI